MKKSLFAGERIAKMQISLTGLSELMPDFTGYINIETDTGAGFVLFETGRPVSAGFFSGEENFSKRPAYEALLESGVLDITVYKYTSDEIISAKAETFDELGITDSESVEENDEESIDSVKKQKDILKESTLNSVMRQPGVRAVSVIFEGFALQSVGDADFEHVAAVTEDLVRAGSKMTSDLMLGRLNQLLLETDEGKLIVAPANELFICVLAENTANLGLIRLSLQAIQYDAGDI
ncbi:roadblock/LC7 domain-containing protein [Methanomicrobium antiquum]|uniref:Roadblock/LC7 domain-containing protein n=1 Tax=Methanomicrobium antiquum TaxID=487686 RepID=A0AAF0FLJ5_9EURY|nr:roadblock/LC7 domain-containing protein [Methanomicrobium antiquum]WFN36738.1 roadblock/LC7 domain-containing protein [Methanomicrobium antiquum]